jgi:hypothetical protein
LLFKWLMCFKAVVERIVLCAALQVSLDLDFDVEPTAVVTLPGASGGAGGSTSASTSVSKQVWLAGSYILHASTFEAHSKRSH